MGTIYKDKVMRTCYHMLLIGSVLYVVVGLVKTEPPPMIPDAYPMPPGPFAYTYMALTPRNIHPGSTLSVPVQFGGPVYGQYVTLELIKTRHVRGLKEPEVTILVEQTTVVPNGDLDVVALLTVPPTITWGSYKLNITGAGSVSFKNSTNVYGRPNSLAIFVQTDKAMYKPGDTVKYRIFTVDRKLGLVDPTLDIEFFDPKGNKIDEVTGVKDKHGVDGSLRLSDYPPLGRWRISVTAKVSKKKENYYFEVKEYVLPRFEVVVTLPPFGKESDNSLTGTAQALYTFGKPVAGNAVVTISKRYGSGFFNIKAARTEMALGVDGTVSFSIPMDVLKRISRRIEYETFVVHANITESISGITLDGEAQIRYHKNPYKIDFSPNMPDNFKPGFNPYKVWIKVTQQDGRPPESITEPISVTVTYFTDTHVANTPQLPGYTVLSPFIGGNVIMVDTKSYLLQNDGTVKFDLNIHEKAATVTIKAEFAGVDLYKEIRRFRSPNNVLLKSTIMNDVHNKPLEIGDILSIKVTSSAGPVKAKYVFLSQGENVDSGDIVIGINNEGIVQIRLTRDMAPTARFLVYYVTDDANIVADGLNFLIEDIFDNKVTIEFLQPSPQMPKQKVTLKVTADKDSLVNILAVDKSVKLLAEGNDITTKRVMDEMIRFGNFPVIMRGWGPVMPWSFPADDVHDIFVAAELKVLTDANLYKFDLWRIQQLETKSRSFSASNDRMGGVGMGAPSSPTGQIRKDFPETWIWKSVIASNGIAEFPEIVPDTITEFQASAFALNTKTGLGVAPTTANLTVFLPFFVNLQLPYSVIRNETVVLQANIFNYMDQDYAVHVRLQASTDFIGVSFDSQNTETEITGDITKCILVKKSQPTAVYFNIKPTEIKDITLNVRATIPNLKFDEVIRTLPVKAEGIEREKNTPILVSHKQSNSFTQVTPITYPTELVVGSERIRVTVTGDVFGPSFENLDKLIRMPYGCGEQNMINFAPMVFAAVYMKATGRYTDKADLIKKIKNFMRTGYQRQLIYQRTDGSFSAFGNADAEGSLWLTTFVIKSFAQAKKLNIIFIDQNIIDRAVRFIIKRTRPDGTIDNVGIVSHLALQGDSPASNRSMLAYVLLSLQEVKQAEILTNPSTISKLDVAIRSITDAIKRNIGAMTTDYEKAIGAYALKLVNDPGYITLLNGLESNSVVKDNRKHWANPSRALSIEITSYALLTYALLRDQTNGMMILKWLIDNRNPYGGYSSTQDTVVALQAFSEFATQIYSKNVNLYIDIYTRTNGVDGMKESIHLSTTNHDVLHYRDFDGSVNEVIIEAKGTGLAVIETNQFFNVKSETGQAYELNVITIDESMHKYTVRACARFLDPIQGSNMAIMDIGAMSGFEPVKALVVQSPLMKRLELAGGRLIIYFDQIPYKEVCVAVPMQRVSIVSGLQAASVIVYSYYEPLQKQMKRYIPSTLINESLCRTCPACCTLTNCQGNTSPLSGYKKRQRKRKGY